MSFEFLEVNSGYRNRVEYPKTANFQIRVAQSGSRDRFSAVDPVCNASPYLVWSSFLSTPFIGSIPYLPQNSPLVFTIYISTGQNASHIRNYYVGAILKLTGLVTNINNFVRIRSWIYEFTSGGNDIFQVTVDASASLLASNNALEAINVTLADPTNITDPASYQIYIPLSVSVNNFYRRQYILNQTKETAAEIVFYDGVTHLARIVPSGPAWASTDVLTLRYALPSSYGLPLTGLTLSTVQLDPSASSVSDFYTGSFLLDQSTEQSRRIIRYDGTTKIATVTPPFSGVPVGNYEILPFTKDNEGFYTFTASFSTVSDAVCYDVCLLHLILPNGLLSSGYGGHAIAYPYLYVKLTQVSASTKQGSKSIASNNPHATQMLFRATIDDNTNFEESPFIRVNGDGMIQRIKLKVGDDFEFGVYFPNGDLFMTEELDQYSPNVPNPLIQLSALFSFQRISN
jgi:hypothetical protein